MQESVDLPIVNARIKTHLGDRPAFGRTLLANLVSKVNGTYIEVVIPEHLARREEEVLSVDEGNHTFVCRLRDDDAAQ